MYPNRNFPRESGGKYLGSLLSGWEFEEPKGPKWLPVYRVVPSGGQTLDARGEMLYFGDPSARLLEGFLHLARATIVTHICMRIHIYDRYLS
jgi:hypothetical protein